MTPIVILVLAMVIVIGECSHFKGGSVSWTPIDGSSITVNFRMSWRQDDPDDPDCDDTTISSGSLIAEWGGEFTCYSGCSGDVGSVGFFCTDYSYLLEYFSGTNTFTYTSTTPQFSFAFADCCYAEFNVGGDDDFRLLTTVDLSVRSDIGRINSSPTVNLPPVIRFQKGCNTTLFLPVADVDGDFIRCRWANGKECESVCNVFPGAILDEDACSITYLGNQDGPYGVALQIEDFADASSTTSFSSIPLQFIVSVYTGADCDNVPVFIAPSPADLSLFTAYVGENFEVSLLARSSIPLQTITTTMASGMTRTAEVPSQSSSWHYMSIDITWSPTANDAGRTHSVCYTATDEGGTSSNLECIRIFVTFITCKSDSCKNGATCTNVDGGGFTCQCAAGYIGETCSCVNKVCSVDRCKNGGTCTALVDDYSCSCAPGFSGKDCSTELKRKYLNEPGLPSNNHDAQNGTPGNNGNLGNSGNNPNNGNNGKNGNRPV